MLDLTNEKYNHLTAKYYEIKKDKNGHNKTFWYCQCDCGNPELIPVFIGHLRSGHTKSCGCLNNAEDLTGQIFGQWKVICRGEDYINNGKKSVTWNCECQACNKTRKDIRSDILKKGGTYSCGCLKKNILLTDREYGIGYDYNNNVFYFDLEDYDKIKKYVWIADKDGYMCANCFRNGKETTVKMHRLVMDVVDNEDVFVDHIKHCHYDNRKSQLRVVNDSQNAMNAKLSKSNTSGITGVSWSKSKNKWEAYITINKKRKNLGRYENIDDAIRVRKEAEEKYFGTYSYDNSMSMNI